MSVSRLQLASLSTLIILPILLLTVGRPAIASLPLGAAPPATAHLQVAGSQTILAGADGDTLGSSVALSGDTLAAGSLYAEVQGVRGGVVHLYAHDPQAPGGWSRVRTLQREPPSSFGAFGEALALQGDTLVVGVPRDPRVANGFWQGAVFIYERNHGGEGAWGLVTQLVDESDGRRRQFGSAVAVDGDLVAVGVQGADSGRGKVYLYSRAAQWARVKTIVDPDGQPGDEFGSAVALEGDTLVVGARYADADAARTDTGATLVFGRNQGGAAQWGLVTRLIADQPLADSSFGDTLVLDGETIVVGAQNENVVVDGQLAASQVGAAYVYERRQGGDDAWGLTAALRPPDGRTIDFFGSGLALAGDDLWVGSPGSSLGGFEQQGILYRYRRDQGGSGAWGAQPPLEAEGGSKLHAFGSNLAVSGTTLVASAPGYGPTGAVYVIDVVEPADPPTAASGTLYLPMVAREATPATGLLADGGSLEEPGGALLGAVPGTLAAPVEATITKVAQPAVVLPLGFTPRGDYYRVAASALTIAPADKPLLVGLPVPQGANTARLALAALMPDGYESGQARPETLTRSWSDLPGSYDPASNLFVATLRTLLPEGVTLVLFEHPENQPLPVAAQARPQQSAAREFDVRCGPAAFSQDACTPANFALLASELEAAFALFVDTHGFRPPALIHMAGVFVGADRRPQLREVYYNIALRTAPCVDSSGESSDGWYNYVTMRLVVCMDVQPDIDNVRKIVRHELFHAIQAGYPRVAEDYFDPQTEELSRWTLEGTAAAAERSSFLMLRSPDFPLRPASEPLTSTEQLLEYSTQDFWVYTGLEGAQTNHYIEYLKPIFEQGATPEHVAEAIPLADAYWAWAKNQVIEHHQPMIDAFVNGPCQLENRTIDPSRMKFLSYPETSRAEGTLLPLSSTLVQIDVEVARAIMPVLASTSASGPDLRYKVYGEDEAGCRIVPDGSRTLLNVAAGSRIFVLVSNVSLSQELDFVVEVD
jgi:hypothetical protein